MKIKNRDKRNAWVTDQFLNPYETVHTPVETLKWFEEERVDFLNLIPHCDEIEIPLLKKRDLPTLSKISEILLMFNRTQVQEGGFFIMIGEKR